MKLITTTIFLSLCLAAGSFSANAQSIKVKKANSKTTTHSSGELEPISPTPNHSGGLSWLPAAAGAQYVNELQTSYSGGSFSTSKVGTQSFTIININATYARLIKEKIQVGVEAGFNSTSGGAVSSTSFTAMGFGSYNFDENIQQSLYAKGGLGMFTVANASGGNDSKFGFMLGGGRRFPIWDRINYSPEVRLYKKGDFDPTFDVQFLNLSILF